MSTSLYIQNPEPFLLELHGKIIGVQLKWGWQLRGILQSKDEYMNLLLANAQGIVNGEKKGQTGLNTYQMQQYTVHKINNLMIRFILTRFTYFRKKVNQTSIYNNLNIFQNYSMARRYDSKTTTFSPDGRLQQLEYAVQAINKTGSAIGIVTSQGVVLVTEKHEASLLLEQSKISQKIYPIDRHIYAVASGLSADGNYLINLLREYAQDYRVKFRSNVPIEELVVHICDIKQYYTQVGGARPFGSAFLFAGYDKNNGFQLYSTDPSGNYAGWKATAIGTNHVAANSFLKQQYKDSMTLEEGYGFALKTLVKTMETTSPSPKKIELVSIGFDMDENIRGITVPEERIAALLKANGLVADKQEEKV